MFGIRVRRGVFLCCASLAMTLHVLTHSAPPIPTFFNLNLFFFTANFLKFTIHYIHVAIAMMFCHASPSKGDLFHDIGGGSAVSNDKVEWVGATMMEDLFVAKVRPRTTCGAIFEWVKKCKLIASLANAPDGIRNVRNRCMAHPRRSL